VYTVDHTFVSLLFMFLPPTITLFTITFSSPVESVAMVSIGGHEFRAAAAIS